MRLGVYVDDVARALHRLNLAKFGITTISIDLLVAYEERTAKVAKGIRLERRKLLGRPTMVYTWQREQKRRPFNSTAYMTDGDGTELTLKEVSDCSSTSITHVLNHAIIKEVDDYVSYEITLECDASFCTPANRERIAEVLDVRSDRIFFQVFLSSAFLR